LVLENLMNKDVVPCPFLIALRAMPQDVCLQKLIRFLLD
jgi:hypothetical protein